MESLAVRDFATAEIEPANSFNSPRDLAIGGTFEFECFDADGNLKWRAPAKNLVPNATLDAILNTFCRAGTAVAAFYMGLVDNAGFTTFAAADVMGGHTGWAENTAYTAASRQAWTTTASTGGAGTLTNATPVSFVMNAAATIRGVFICSDPSSNSGSVILLAEAPFTTGSQAVNSGDTLKGTYTLSAVST